MCLYDRRFHHAARDGKVRIVAILAQSLGHNIDGLDVRPCLAESLGRNVDVFGLDGL